MKILIISTSYPPRATVGGLRPAMMANYLVKAGHECAVLTVSLDAILQRDPEFLKVDERITEMRVSPILINPYESYLPAGVSPGFLHKVIRRMMTYWAPDVYYFWAIRAARAYVRHPPLKPEVVISSALPFSVHHAGRIIAKKFKAIWVADCRDLWAGNPHLGMSLKRQEWAFVHQSKLLSMASYVLGVSDEMVDILRESLPNHVPSATLMNAFNEVALGVDFEQVLKRYKLKRKGKNLKIIDKRKSVKTVPYEEYMGGLLNGA